MVNDTLELIGGTPVDESHTGFFLTGNKNKNKNQPKYQEENY